MAQAAVDRSGYDVFDPHCPSRRLLDAIGDKWASLVVVALGQQQSLRYSELMARIAGVSQKMLTQTLRRLERDGLLTRTVTPTVPVRVDYELTGLGRSLLEVICQLKEWAEDHMGEVDDARAAYDRANSNSGTTRATTIGGTGRRLRGSTAGRDVDRQVTDVVERR